VKCHQTLTRIAGCFDLSVERDQAFRDEADVVAQALGDDVEVAPGSDSLIPNFCANGSEFLFNLSIHVAPRSNNPTIVVRDICGESRAATAPASYKPPMGDAATGQKLQRTAIRLRSGCGPAEAGHYVLTKLGPAGPSRSSLEQMAEYEEKGGPDVPDPPSKSEFRLCAFASWR